MVHSWAARDMTPQEACDPDLQCKLRACPCACSGLASTSMCTLTATPGGSRGAAPHMASQESLPPWPATCKPTSSAVHPRSSPNSL